MEVTVEQLSDTTVKVALTGRLDIEGADAIGDRLTAITATHREGVVIDMAGVDFLASIGIRLLLSNARAQKLRGGKLVLARCQPMVREVLRATGADTLLAVHDELDAALADVNAALVRP